MIRDELERLIYRHPFEPFRITLSSGSTHDIRYPDNVALQETIVHLTPPDQHWAIFPLTQIASLESLLADYQGEEASHAAGE